MSDYDGAACGCCQFCFKFIFVSGLTALFVWLSVRTSNPKCSIDDFYVPALNSSDVSTRNNSHNISLILKFENTMKDKDVRYDELNLTLFYEAVNSSQAIGNKTMPGFKQGHSKKARKNELVETHGVPWDDALRAASNKSAVFRVSVASKVRFKITFWYTKRHDWKFEGSVTVDDSGRRTSGGVAGPRCCSALVGLSILLYSLTLMV